MSLQILKRLIVQICILSVLAMGMPAHADTWLPPSTDTVESENGRYRFTVEPSPLDSSLSYFTEELDAKRHGETTERVPPMGLLEFRHDDGQWMPVWAAPLLNQIAPASSIVSDSGTVVTFDNWHSVGHGDNVIVIYDRAGKMVRTMQLSELLPEQYIEALPHSVSSLSWREDASFSPSGEKLLLDVLVPSEDREEAPTVRFAISMSDGAVTNPDDASWSQAVEAADRVTEIHRQAEAEQVRFLSEPIRAPADCDMGEWHRYLREAFFRLTPEWLDLPSTSTTILFPSDHERLDESIGWLTDKIADLFEFKGNAAFAAPCAQPELISTLRTAFARIKDGELAGSSIYISTGASARAVLEPIMAPSGAAIYWLDPTISIPQRPERIAGSPAQAASEREILRRQEAEMMDLLDELDGL